MPVKLRTLQFDPARGGDAMVDVGTLPFNPASYTSVEDAATAFHKALSVYASAEGYGDKSVSIWTPAEAIERGYHGSWMVSWEDGPFQWGINMSFQVTGPWGYTEPHYAFDLCFVH